LKIKHANILQNIWFVEDGDYYDVECDNGYEVAQQRLGRKYRYIGGPQSQIKAFQVQNSNGRDVFIAEKVIFTTLVCREGKQ